MLIRPATKIDHFLGTTLLSKVALVYFPCYSVTRNKGYYMAARRYEICSKSGEEIFPE